MTMLTRLMAATVLVLLLAGCGHNPTLTPTAALAQIVGTVTAGPTCPVERLSSPCPDRPVPGASVRALRGTSVVTTTMTDSGGRYRLTVDPGDYTVLATNAGGYRSTASRRVTALAGEQTTVDLVVDTGIR
jgi:hypothetical protein